MSKKREPDVSENPLYHDTWTLLRKYRDVVWSLELSVQRVRRQFQIEFGSSIEDFLESIDNFGKIGIFLILSFHNYEHDIFFYLFSFKNTFKLGL